MAKAKTKPSKVESESSELDPGVSIRFGPVQTKDVEMKDADSASKRKARTSVSHRKSYAESESSDEDDQPLVRHTLPTRYFSSSLAPLPPLCWFQRLTISTEQASTHLREA